MYSMKRYQYQIGYFAHSKQKYNTSEEKNEYDFINKNFYGITICPNANIGELGDIKPYLDIVRKADVVFASELNECIGRGVYDECKLALEMAIPVFVIRMKNNNYYFDKLSSLEIINEWDYKRYAKFKTKNYSPKKLPVVERPKNG